MKRARERTACSWDAAVGPRPARPAAHRPRRAPGGRWSRAGAAAEVWTPGRAPSDGRALVTAAARGAARRARGPTAGAAPGSRGAQRTLHLETHMFITYEIAVQLCHAVH